MFNIVFFCYLGIKKDLVFLLDLTIELHHIWCCKV